MKSDQFKCFLCDFGWIILLIFFVGLALFFTRRMWLPIISSAGDAPASIVAPTQTSFVQLSATRTPVVTLVLKPTENLTVTQVEESAPKAGEMGSDFISKNLSGEDILFSSFIGQPILLVAFGAGCPHCQDEAPSLQAIYEEFQSEGLQIVAVNAWGESQSEVQRFKETYGLEFPVLLDSEGDFITLYKIESVPTNIFIDSKGIISQIIVGEMEKNQLREAIKSLVME